MSRTVLGLALLAAGLALAAPQAPPPPGPTPPFELPTTTEFTLKNGLRVTLVRYGAIPKTNVALVVKLGNADEAAHQTGLADLMGKLLLQGTTTRSAVQLAEAAAKLGGELEANVREDETALEIECLGESTHDAIRLVAEVARTPAFPAAEVARLRGDLLREVAIQRSQPQPLAEEAFARAIYGDHPYGRVLPVASDVEKFTLEQAKQLWTRFAGANRAHLYVVGRFEPAAARGAIEEAFSGWHKAKGAQRPKPSPKGGRRVFLLDRPGAVQSTVRFGLPAIPPTSPDYIPLV
ncbi:MAG TPA: pitrilysin family protein, partial [Myxococcaceae bacterium]